MQQSQWTAHRRIAQDLGLDPAIIAAIARADPPPMDGSDHALVWRLSLTILQDGKLDESARADALQRLGEVLFNLTTGAGARFSPDETDPNRNSTPGMATPEDRMSYVLDLKPDICSLDIATMNFGEHAFVNTPAHVRHIAQAVRAAGVKPELEVFDLGHIALACHLQANGLFDDPPLLQLCTGIPWGAPATARAMLVMQDTLPHGAIWSAFGVGSRQFPMAAVAAAAGGHVRVGLEDNLYLARGVLAQGNAPLVARAADLVRAIGREPATPQQAREILHLR